MIGQRPGLAVLLLALAALAGPASPAAGPAGDCADGAGGAPAAVRLQPGDPTGPVGEPGDPPIPSVAIRVRVPADGEPGQELTYRISVVNTSAAAAHHVTVRNPLPAGTRFVRADPPLSAGGQILVWNLGTLNAWERREVTLVLDPGTATEVRNCARVQFEHGECVLTRIARPAGAPSPVPLRPAPTPTPSPPLSVPGGGALLVRKIGPVQAQLNDIVLYRIQVTNVGRVRLRNVALTDVLPDGIDASNVKPGVQDETTPPLVWQLGDLDPGQVREVRYDALLKKAGDLTNRAIAEAAGGLRQEVRHTIRVGSPALAVLLTGPAQRLVGRPATYQITVSNPGTVPLTNVELHDELVPEVEFLSATNGGRLDGKQVRWSLGTLPAGGRHVVKVTVRGRARGKFKNVVTASADRGLIEQGITQTRFGEEAGLGLEIDKPMDPVEVGREGRLTVRLLNTGKEAEKGVNATLTLPEGLVVLDAGDAGVSGQKVKLRPVANLAPGVEPSVIVRFRADRSGEMAVTAEATSEKTGPASPVRVEETMQVLPAMGAGSFKK